MNTIEVMRQAIPALTDDEMEQAYRVLWREKPSDFDFTTHSWIELGARWAYALAAERAGVQIKDPLQELADDAKQIGLEY